MKKKAYVYEKKNMSCRRNKRAHADEKKTALADKKKHQQKKIAYEKKYTCIRKKMPRRRKNDPCIRKQIAHTDEKNVHAYENKTHIHPDEEKKNVLVYDRKKTLFRQKRTYMQTKQRCCIHKNAYTYEKKNDHADENKKH